MIRTNFYKNGVGVAGSAQNLDEVHQQETQGAPAKTEISVANGSGLLPQSTEKSTGKRLREREVSEDGNVAKKPRLEDEAVTQEVLPKTEVQKDNAAKEAQTLVPWVEKFGAGAIDNCLESFSQISFKELMKKAEACATEEMNFSRRIDNESFNTTRNQFLMFQGMLEFFKPKEGSAEFLEWKRIKEILDLKINQMNEMMEISSRAQEGLKGFSEWMMPFFRLDKCLNGLGLKHSWSVPYLITFLTSRLSERKSHMLESSRHKIFLLEGDVLPVESGGLLKSLNHFKAALIALNASSMSLCSQNYESIPFWFKCEVLQFNLNCVKDVLSVLQEKIDIERSERKAAKMHFDVEVPKEQDPREIECLKVIGQQIEKLEKFLQLSKLGIRLEELMFARDQDIDVISEIICRMDEIVHDIGPACFDQFFSKKYKTFLDQKKLMPKE